MWKPHQCLPCDPKAEFEDLGDDEAKVLSKFGVVGVLKGFPMHDAAYNGSFKAVELLLKLEHPVNKRESNDGATATFIAAAQGKVEIVKMLVEHKADVDIPNCEGASPTFIAAQKGHVEVVTVLAYNKADVNKPHSNGATPLFIASVNGQEKVVEALLAANADINHVVPDGGTALDIAIAAGHTGIEQLLRNQGAQQESQS